MPAVDLLDSINQKYDGTISGLDANNAKQALDEIVADLATHAGAADPHSVYAMPADVTYELLVTNGDVGTSAGQLLTGTHITYELLNTNGDVGTGAGQLAIGNHLHTGVYEPADADITKGNEVETISGIWNFTANSTALTQTAGNNTTRIATTAFVNTAISAATPTWLTKTNTYTAVSGDHILADTGGNEGAFTITLPTSPQAGWFVVFKTYDSAATNNLTITSTSNINQSGADLVVDLNHQMFTLVYIDATYGWVL